jgi:RimJ/RimL family protein N-acetyltransferase
MRFETSRLVLRSWREDDRDVFAKMHSDPEAMRDMGGPFLRDRSDAKFDRYAEAFNRSGYCRWAVEDRNGNFVGYTGLMPSRAGHPLGAHSDIGWRFNRSAWGNGYATEAARAALQDAFKRVGLTEVLAYTSPNNLRSQAVMTRLGLERAEALDYSEPAGGEIWRGLVWIARPNVTERGETLRR